jgi:hypothetical protein
VTCSVRVLTPPASFAQHGSFALAFAHTCPPKSLGQHVRQYFFAACTHTSLVQPAPCKVRLLQRVLRVDADPFEYGTDAEVRTDIYLALPWGANMWLMLPERANTSLPVSERAGSPTLSEGLPDLPAPFVDLRALTLIPRRVDDDDDDEIILILSPRYV